MLRALILLSLALLAPCCCSAQELNVVTNTDIALQARDRRSIDVGWLLRNLLLNSATASDLKANVTRNIVASKRPPPSPAPTTRRPRTTRPPTTQAPPPPPPSPFNPFFDKWALFASSSNLWKPTPRPTTTTAEPMTDPPPPPPSPPTRRPRPPPRPRPRPRPRPHPRPKPYPPTYGFGRPPYGIDFEYFYPTADDGSLGGGGGPRPDPADYDYDNVPAAQSAPPPSPSPQPPPPPPPRPPQSPPSTPPRKSARNRQRPTPAPTESAPPPPPPVRRRPVTSAPATAPAPSAPQPQRDRLLYQYAQRDDTSSNDNNDDADLQPEFTPEADAQPLVDDSSSVADENGAGQSGVASEGGDNEIPTDSDAAFPPELLTSRLPSFGRTTYPKSSSSSTSPFGSSSYYDTISSSGNPYSSFNAGSHGVSSNFGSSSYDFSRASPAKGNYQFRDAFSDFHTTYDGDHFPSDFSAFKSYT